jgi:hypothetical protein
MLKKTLLLILGLMVLINLASLGYGDSTCYYDNNERLYLISNQAELILTGIIEDVKDEIKITGKDTNEIVIFGKDPYLLYAVFRPVQVIKGTVPSEIIVVGFAKNRKPPDATYNKGERCLVFLSKDTPYRHYRTYGGADGKIDSSEENVEKIKNLIGKPPVKITIQPDKIQYACGEPIMVNFRIENIGLLNKVVVCRNVRVSEKSRIDFIITEPDGKQIEARPKPILGPLLKGDDFISLYPDEFFGMKLKELTYFDNHVEKIYNLQYPGLFSIKAVYINEEAQNEAYTGSVISNIVTFEVVEDGKEKQ